MENLPPRPVDVALSMRVSDLHAAFRAFFTFRKCAFVDCADAYCDSSYFLPDLRDENCDFQRLKRAFEQLLDADLISAATERELCEVCGFSARRGARSRKLMVRFMSSVSFITIFLWYRMRLRSSEGDRAFLQCVETYERFVELQRDSPRTAELLNEHLGKRMAEACDSLSPVRAKCSMCGVSSQHHCSKCDVVYCGREHQREDWKRHRHVCIGIVWRGGEHEYSDRNEDLYRFFTIISGI